MKTYREQPILPHVPISSREAAERAAALTKEENVVWESQRSFSILGKKYPEFETRKHEDKDRDVTGAD
jgi:hypothetical protein